MIILGIDPDVDQSGIARLDVAERKCYADHMPFALLIEYCNTMKEVARRRGRHLKVVVEASWLSGHNWHISRFDNPAVAAKKGEGVGRMHETGRKIVEMLEHSGIEVVEQHPLKKIWQGKDGKITHEEMTMVCGWDKKRSNQEERDAMLLAWNASGLPIMVRRTTTKNG